MVRLPCPKARAGLGEGRAQRQCLFCVFLDSVFVYLASIHHPAGSINYIFLFSVSLVLWHLGSGLANS